MLFIILHFIAHGLNIAGYYEEDNITTIGVILNSHFIIAVNCFILISGYFSIKANVRGFLHLYLICFFYKMGLILFASFYSGLFSYKSIITAFFPFSHSELWFITVYVYLYLLSPLLNGFVNKINKKEFTIVLLCFGVLTFYFGFFWRGVINSNGYNIMNFMFLYLIGRFIALCTNDTGDWNKKSIYMAIYFICSFLIAGFVITMCKLNLNKSDIPIGYQYNSPLVIISSIAFFLFFRTLRIKSKLINWLAGSVLAIYLIHQASAIRDHLYKYISEIGKQITNEFLLIGYLIILAIGIMIICILIDRVRIFVVEPIEKILGKINIEKNIDIIVDKIIYIIK
jgi:surface polysaccharide O-acyltransferase-like enzyme